MNYCKLFATTKRTISTIFYIRRQKLNIYGGPGVGSWESAFPGDAAQGWKSWKHWTPWPFFGGNVFDSFTNSCDFQMTSALQTHTHPGGKIARCSFFGCFSAAPFVPWRKVIFCNFSTARGSQNARNPGIFSFSSLLGWCWWPICLDINLHPENARRSAFHGDLSKYVQSWDFFPGNDAASNRWFSWRMLMFKFSSGVAASTASNMGHHLGRWVR